MKKLCDLCQNHQKSLFLTKIEQTLLSIEIILLWILSFGLVYLLMGEIPHHHIRFSYLYKLTSTCNEINCDESSKDK